MSSTHSGKRPPQNVQAKLLSDVENEQVFNLLGSKRYTLATAVVQVFFALGNQHQQWVKQHCGVACFVKDNQLRSYFIRVYDIVRNVKVWEQEVYNRFQYQTPQAFFHVFATEDCWAGLNFASSREALLFKNVVTEKLNLKQQRKSTTKPGTRQAPGPPTPSIKTTKAPSAPDGSKGSSFLKKKDKDKKKQKGRGKFTKADISSPEEGTFVHVSHVGWDAQKGFDTDSMDADMVEWFEDLGVSKDQLKDQQTASFIKGFIDRNGGFDAVKQDVEMKRQYSRRAPAPPVSATHATHAPLPPSVTTHSAPPPPKRSPRPNRRPPPPPTMQTGLPQPPINRPLPPTPPRDIQRQLPPAPSHSMAPKLPSPSTPPSQSTRYKSYAAPPVPQPYITTGDDLPPPPPPPPLRSPSNDIPPPPPPPPPSDITLGTEVGGGQDLLNQIKNKNLRSADHADRPAPSGDSRGALMDQIKTGFELKSVSDMEPLSRPVSQVPDGIGAALFSALQKRQHVMQASDDELGTDDEDFDDEDWSDDD